MTPAAAVLGSLTIPGRPEQVSRARAFVTALAGRAGRDDSRVIPSEELAEVGREHLIGRRWAR